MLCRNFLHRRDRDIPHLGEPTDPTYGLSGRGATLGDVPDHQGRWRYARGVTYAKENLHGQEQLVLDLHPHWWTITPSILTLALSLLFGIVALAAGWPSAVQALAGILVLVCLVWFAIRYVQMITTEFVLTTDRVIYRYGVVAKRGVEIPLESINAIHFSQKIWERALGLGDLKVDSASVEGVSEFENIRQPNRVQNEIYIQMEGNENRKFDRVAQGLAANPPATPAGPAPLPLHEQLEKLAELRDRGVLTEAEFQAKKAELLSRM
jgi:membrane protein YdbS with pleckstrin-like domain